MACFVDEILFFYTYPIFSLEYDHVKPFRVIDRNEEILGFRMISKSAGYSNPNMINLLKDRSVTHRACPNIWFTVS